MDADEKIKAHLLSVWRKEKKFFSRGKECMLLVTTKHVMFISKTEAKMKWWKAAVQRQAVILMKSPDTMLIHDGYDEKNLQEDMQNEKNEVFLLTDVISVDSEEKSWGSVLNLKIRDGEKEKSFELSIVRDWVGYPIRDPIKFLKVDWKPIVQYIREKGVTT